MEREQATPSTLGLYEGERGAGGKSRKPPARKPPATPYDRPPANQSQRSVQQRDGGWLSKLVDPACRLIAGGATRIFPSFFSRSPSTNDLLPYSAEDHDKSGVEVKPNVTDDDQTCSLDVGRSPSTGQTGLRKSPDKLLISTKGVGPSGSDIDKLAQDKISSLSNDNEFYKIEQLMKGKIFSRDEINRLTEILNSRVVDSANIEEETSKPSMNTTGEPKGDVPPPENPVLPVEGKQDGFNRAILGVPHLQSTMLNEVGASPVDIAKAYMGIRASEVGLGAKSMVLKNERALFQGDEFASKPFIQSPSLKSSVCWPGAIMQDRPVYLTPQSQRGRSGIHNFPRSPYSRSIYSKSKSKPIPLQAVNDTSLNILSTPLQQSRTPIFRQAKSRNDVFNDGFGSVGPVRRIRHKFVSEATPRGSVCFPSSQNGSSQVENPSVSTGFLPAVKKNLDPGVTSSSSEVQLVDSISHSSRVGVPTALPSSGPAVRAIMEHLDRSNPTPREKSAELKLATAWKKPSSSKMADVMPRERISLTHIQETDPGENADLADQKFPGKGNKDGESSESKKGAREISIIKVADAVNKDKGSRTFVSKTNLIQDGNAMPSIDFKRTQDSRVASAHEKTSVSFANSVEKGMGPIWSIHSKTNGQDVSRVVPNTFGAELPEKPPSQFLFSSRTKLNLGSISVDKPDLRRIISSDNSSGFTFPVSASSGTLSEPPTPSVLPSFSSSTGGLSLPEQGPAVPSYTFGTKKSKPSLVFSFPSTSNGSAHDQLADLKFNFGSDKKTRVSFSSVGKDAICY